MIKIYRDYLKNIYETYMTGDATEPSYYPLLKELVENFGKESGKAAGVTAQPKKTKVAEWCYLLQTGILVIL